MSAAELYYWSQGIPGQPQTRQAMPKRNRKRRPNQKRREALAKANDVQPSNGQKAQGNQSQSSEKSHDPAPTIAGIPMSQLAKVKDARLAEYISQHGTPAYRAPRIPSGGTTIRTSTAIPTTDDESEYSDAENESATPAKAATENAINDSQPSESDSEGGGVPVGDLKKRKNSFAAPGVRTSRVRGLANASW